MKYLNFGHTSSPAEYQQTIAHLLVDILEQRTEILPLAEAHLRYVAKTMVAPSNIPAFANSQMDGYALTASAAERKNRVFTVGEDIPAGVAADVEINDDIAYPIMTGAPLPTGYDCVIPEERAILLGDREAAFAATGSSVKLPAAPAGQFVRYPGEDIRAGEQLVDAGSRLTGATLGALAAQGIGSVAVKAPLKVLVLTGGDEVAPAGEDLAAGKIFDANGPMLVAQLAEFSALVIRHHLTDRAEDLVEFLTDYLRQNQVDVILSSGGISHGKYEVIRNAVQMLEENNFDLTVSESWFGHVTQQPGGPQGVTLLKSRGRTIPLVSFPGNPVSTLVTYTLVLRPALDRFYSGKDSATYHGRLVSQGMSAPADKTQFRRARVIPTEAGFIIEADSATGSHLLHRAAAANALVELEAGMTYQPGDTLRWYPVNDF